MTTILASLLASCSAAEEGGTPRVDGTELCADFASFGGRELWLTGPIDPRSTILYRNERGNVMCPPAACCSFATYLYGFSCPGVNIVIVPQSLAREPVADTDPNMHLIACGSLSDGTETGGACRPTSCGLADAPNVTGITAVRGTLATSLHDPTAWQVLTNPDLQPILIFTAHEVELSPTAFDPVDANFGPDASF